MAKKYKILFLLLPLFVLSCRNNTESKSINNLVSDTLPINDKNVGIEIDYDKTKVLKSIYVVNRKGTDMKQLANENSQILGNYKFGAQLEVIEETEKWYGVRERITREFFKNGDKIESTGWEKVYVLKSATGSINKITLISSDLNIVSSLNANQKNENFETDNELNDFLKMELINKQIFDNKRSSSVNFLLADTTVIKKKNGTIELKCLNKVVKYIDKPSEEENEAEFNYIGQFEFLNKYLINSSYYESSDYRLIDKNNGEEIVTFGDYPNISADKKHIICIYTNPYETTADLELYSISNNQIKFLMSTSFKNWMPTAEPREMFWSTDGYLYLTVNHVKSFWIPDGNLNDKRQYIRIGIL